MTLRLLTIISISLAFILVIKPEELIKALELFRLPYTLAFTLGLALSHINTMSDEYRAIKESRISRGLELDHGSLLKRIKNYTYILTPLLIRAMETAEKITLAMELKAFNLRKIKHKIDYRLNIIDYLIITIMIITIGVSIVYYNFRGILL
jgi:energy-coupling factor transport system permease protein